MRIATPTDTQAIYGLLKAVNFAHLPDYEQAKPILEATHQLVVEKDDNLALWVNIHLHNDQRLMIDVAVNPQLNGKIITRGLCKQVLTYCLDIADSVYMKAYNPRAVKLALLMGFKLTDEADEAGWVTLKLTRADLRG
jgi:N-acetylglutamate synthase-like GNAT family acetyltransferase